MSRLIDADNVIFELNRMLDIVDERNAKPDQKEEFKTIRTYVEWTKEVIHNAPTIELIQCKDCEYAELRDGKYRLCLLTGTWKVLDHFCKDGERREE